MNFVDGFIDEIVGLSKRYGASEVRRIVMSYVLKAKVLATRHARGLFLLGQVSHAILINCLLALYSGLVLWFMAYQDIATGFFIVSGVSLLLYCVISTQHFWLKVLGIKDEIRRELLGIRKEDEKRRTEDLLEKRIEKVVLSKLDRVLSQMETLKTRPPTGTSHTETNLHH